MYHEVVCACGRAEGIAIAFACPVGMPEGICLAVKQTSDRTLAGAMVGTSEGLCICHVGRFDEILGNLQLCRESLTDAVAVFNHFLQLCLGTVDPLLCCCLVHGLQIPLCILAAAFPANGQTAIGTGVVGHDVVVSALLVLGSTDVNAGNLLLCYGSNALLVEVECRSVGVGGCCQLGIGICGNAIEDLALVHVDEAVLCGLALYGLYLPKEFGG